MSLDNLLNHLCDIYHLQETQTSPGYGLEASPAFSYLPKPDIHEQRCHFGVRSQSVTITQTDPINLMDAKIKLTLPAGTDVQLNDKIVDCATGLEYTAEQPVDVRGHHTFVYIKKTEGQKAL
jgi:hypothetical protein